jgi:hypothetical protein
MTRHAASDFTDGRLGRGVHVEIAQLAKMAGMAGRYPGSYLDRCDGWRAAAILDWHRSSFTRCRIPEAGGHLRRHRCYSEGTAAWLPTRRLSTSHSTIQDHDRGAGVRVGVVSQSAGRAEGG